MLFKPKSIEDLLKNKTKEELLCYSCYNGCYDMFMKLYYDVNINCINDLSNKTPIMYCLYGYSMYLKTHLPPHEKHKIDQYHMIFQMIITNDKVNLNLQNSGGFNCFELIEILGFDKMKRLIKLLNKI